MNIAIIGHGRMGHLVEEAAQQRRMSVVATIDPNGSARYSTISSESIGRADVCVCFTQPGSVLETVQQIAVHGKSIVMGTTGWYERMDDVRSIVDQSGIGFVYSPNFAIGVNLFFKIVEASAKLVDVLDDYDLAVHETHHSRKLDSPSGTAQELAKVLLANVRRKREQRSELGEPISADEIHVSSTRCGHVPGQHTVLFDSEVDSIELIHTARSRKGFAVGALIAANWVANRKGFFTKEDVVDDLFGANQTGRISGLG